MGARGRRRAEAALLERVREALLPAAGTPLVVAVSGGVDSSVLLSAVARLAEELTLRLVVAHVHHGLRGDAADRDARFAAAVARAHGLPSQVLRVVPRGARSEAPNSRQRPSLQEAARRLRYDALADVAARAGARFVAMAHTLDDQAETVLLRILRGTGPDGVGGMEPRAPWPGSLPTELAALEILRPLLSSSRPELVEFARFHRVSWREDDSNRDRHYARNRLRHEWLPGLRGAFNPRLTQALAGLAEMQREESRWRERIVESESSRRFEREVGGIWIDPKDWDDAALPTALGRRLARRALHDLGAGRSVSHRHIERMLAFLRKARVGTILELPDGLSLRRYARGFYLGRSSFPPVGEC